MNLLCVPVERFPILGANLSFAERFYTLIFASENKMCFFEPLTVLIMYLCCLNHAVETGKVPLQVVTLKERTLLGF
jgi:hypothetical protein